MSEETDALELLNTQREVVAMVHKVLPEIMPDAIDFAEKLEDFLAKTYPDGLHASVLHLGTGLVLGGYLREAAHMLYAMSVISVGFHNGFAASQAALADAEQKPN
jgi:tRNA U34 5-methylaminomethyl-2-thiouridine-forming methyltransferase MnmC